MNCKVCDKNNAECHHIVFRSQCKQMIDIDLNKIYLCNSHHTTGNNSPHKNKETDLRYKKILQAELFTLFNEYEEIPAIKSKLKTTLTNTLNIVKTLKLYDKGYKREDIVRLLMGGRLY